MIGIEFNGANQVTFRTGPREVAAEYCLAEGSVTFGKIWIELHCRLSSFVRRRGTFRKRGFAVDPTPLGLLPPSQILATDRI